MLSGTYLAAAIVSMIGNMKHPIAGKQPEWIDLGMFAIILIHEAQGRRIWTLMTILEGILHRFYPLFGLKAPEPETLRKILTARLSANGLDKDLTLDNNIIGKGLDRKAESRSQWMVVMDNLAVALGALGALDKSRCILAVNRVFLGTVDEMLLNQVSSPSAVPEVIQIGDDDDEPQEPPMAQEVQEPQEPPMAQTPQEPHVVEPNVDPQELQDPPEVINTEAPRRNRGRPSESGRKTRKMAEKKKSAGVAQTNPQRPPRRSCVNDSIIDAEDSESEKDGADDEGVAGPSHPVAPLKAKKAKKPARQRRRVTTASTGTALLAIRQADQIKRVVSRYPKLLNEPLARKASHLVKTLHLLSTQKRAVQDLLKELKGQKDQSVVGKRRSARQQRQ